VALVRNGYRCGTTPRSAAPTMTAARRRRLHYELQRGAGRWPCQRSLASTSWRKPGRAQSRYAELPRPRRPACRRTERHVASTGLSVRGQPQCEEWAMARGECPVGGVKVSGYNTSAARYCAITGGNIPYRNEAHRTSRALRHPWRAMRRLAYYSGSVRDEPGRA